METKTRGGRGVQSDFALEAPSGCGRLRSKTLSERAKAPCGSTEARSDSQIESETAARFGANYYPKYK